MGSDKADNVSAYVDLFRLTLGSALGESSLSVELIGSCFLLRILFQPRYRCSSHCLADCKLQRFIQVVIVEEAVIPLVWAKFSADFHA